MTAVLDNPNCLEVAEFEMEVPTERWSWSPSLFDIVGLSSSLKPSTRLLLSIKHTRC